MNYLGKLNREIFSCITPDIVTDEVVITDERVRHIKERHPGDYERITAYWQRLLAEPDYILADKKPYTGLILKKIEENGLQIQMVLRLRTLKDETGYKNSVISAWTISDGRWQNYLRNKKILYRRE